MKEDLDQEKVHAMAKAIGDCVFEVAKGMTEEEAVVGLGLACGTICGTAGENMASVSDFMHAFSTAVRESSAKTDNPLVFALESSGPGDQH